MSVNKPKGEHTDHHFGVTSIKWTNKNQAASAPHAHAIGDVNGLQAALDSKSGASSIYIDGIITEGETPAAPGIYIVRPL